LIQGESKKAKGKRESRLLLLLPFAFLLSPSPLGLPFAFLPLPSSTIS
jgi:hypothetical protein